MVKFNTRQYIGLTQGLRAVNDRPYFKIREWQCRHAQPKHYKRNVTVLISGLLRRHCLMFNRLCVCMYSSIEPESDFGNWYFERSPFHKIAP